MMRSVLLSVTALQVGALPSLGILLKLATGLGFLRKTAGAPFRGLSMSPEQREKTVVALDEAMSLLEAAGIARDEIGTGFVAFGLSVIEEEIGVEKASSYLKLLRESCYAREGALQ